MRNQPNLFPACWGVWFKECSQQGISLPFLGLHTPGPGLAVWRQEEGKLLMVPEQRLGRGRDVGGLKQEKSKEI